jgi:uncharacterized protein
MSKPVVEVQVRGVTATGGGCAVFLGNEEKVFLIFVEQSVGAAIAMFKQGTQKERPLTHDLLANILRALGAKIERVIVNDLKLGAYFARLVLSAENELKQKKIMDLLQIGTSLTWRARYTVHVRGPCRSSRADQTGL